MFESSDLRLTNVGDIATRSPHDFHRHIGTVACMDTVSGRWRSLTSGAIGDCINHVI